MKEFDDEVTEQIYWTRFATGVPDHVSVAAHKKLHPLIAARSLQDVDVFGPILRWPNLHRRLGLQVDGKWHITFEWCEQQKRALRLRLERR